MRASKPAALAFIALLLAGCTAAALDSGVPRTGTEGGNAVGTRDGGRADVSIRVPRERKGKHYVSPNTKSLTVAANGKTIGTFNLSAKSKGCSSSVGYTQCVFNLVVPTGKIDFTVKTYALFSGKGQVLSEGSVVQRISPNKLAVIALTLSGVVSTVAVNLGAPNPPAGAAMTTPVYVTAYDPSGAAIIGPGNYSVPVVLSDADTSGTTTLTNPTISGPNGVATLGYTGASLVSATINATAGTIPATNVTPAVFAPTPTVLAIYSFPPALATDEAYAIANGPGGLWLSADNNSASPEAIVQVMTSGAMTAYIGGVTPGLTADRYLGIVQGPDGNVWFTERASKSIGVLSTTTGTVTEYSATGTAGTACPNRITDGPATDGALWFTSTCNGIIGRITTAGVVQTFAPTGAGKDLGNITLGKDSNLYVNDRSNKAIAQIMVASGAIAAFSERQVGANQYAGTPDGSLVGLTQTGDGTLWWTDQQCAPSTVGYLNIAPIFSQSAGYQYSTLQGCAFPANDTVAPAGSQVVWVAEFGVPTIEQAIVPTGGGFPTFTDVPIPTATGTPWDIVLGPDGNVWSTIRNGNGAAIVKLAY